MMSCQWFLTQWGHTFCSQSSSVFPRGPVLCSAKSWHLVRNESTVLIPPGEPWTLPTHVSGSSQDGPQAGGPTCKNNHSKAPAGVSQDAAPQDDLLVVERVFPALPRERARELIQFVVGCLADNNPCKNKNKNKNKNKTPLYDSP